MTFQIDDLRIKAIKELISPEQLHEQYPVTEIAAETIHKNRQAIKNILKGDDDRLLVIIGPCSIHDVDAAKEYAQRLQKMYLKFERDLVIVMRVYFEKPRTRVGWKGLINDPDLDGSFQINRGLGMARELLLYINGLGVSAATEYLDLISPQYVADLIGWGAIGARTTESQVHRELASGLSCPVGFKNGTDGTLSIAIDAIRSAQNPHHFLSLTKEGRSAIFSTTGNEDCHIILRGGKSPNYTKNDVNQAMQQLKEAGLPETLMIDLSHANSSKQFQKQIEVGQDVADQISTGNTAISGVMIESHLVEGRQNVVEGEPLVYGQSITDACINWENSEVLLQTLADAVVQRREKVS
jgi:3-deoxy-7-phosphoheptulonate synthase